MRNTKHVRLVQRCFLLFSMAAAANFFFCDSWEQQQREDSRNLRFFDPDHALCGDSVLSHEFAVHTMYGAKLKTEGWYYEQNTVTTRQPLPLEPENFHQLERVLRAMAYVARNAEPPRAIRVAIPMRVGYLKEIVQPFSIVSADHLNETGVHVVDPAFWSRSSGLRLKNIETVNVANCTTVDKLKELVEANHTQEELMFDLDDLLEIDQEALGKLVGRKGGYDSDAGEWITNFTCQETHKEPPSLPVHNDQENWGISLYDNDRQDSVW